ncbi:uncharacterized protein LOC129557857 [Moschus berezovskii]|uniref:uncharacterized protein LOC129557857 n=1 Tax=Moschus berezovskii TaxID=68408 RepID=UPI0024439672|nr:uncharacterized protein LOC129557857 [Moschus berezovskii]
MRFQASRNSDFHQVSSSSSSLKAAMGSLHYCTFCRTRAAQSSHHDTGLRVTVTSCGVSWMTSDPAGLEPLLLSGRLRRTWVLLAGLSNSPPQPFLIRFAFKSHREVTDRRLPKSSLAHQAHFGWISRHSSHEVALPLVHMLRPGSRGTSAQSPRRQEHRSAGARGMVGRPAQRLRGRRTRRGRAAGERGSRAGGLGRTGGGGGCAGPRPAATIPPAALAAESRGRRRAGSPAGAPGVSPLGTAPAGDLGRGGTAGSALRPRLRLRDASRAEAPPRAGKLLPVSSSPALAFLAPARRAPLSSSPHSSPSLPFPAPARLPHGPLTARRGGPSSIVHLLKPFPKATGHDLVTKQQQKGH